MKGASEPSVVYNAAAEIPGTEPLDERELVKHAARGDRNAYRSLVERYQGRIFALAFSLLRSREDAEDITQETFVKGYLSLKSFQGASSFYTWIYRIAYNMVIDFRRRVDRRGGAAVELQQAEQPGESLQAELGERENPEKVFERKQTIERIGQALLKLSPAHRAVVMLREIDGMSYDEIADVVGVSKGTVMSRLHYARKHLQQELADMYGITATGEGSPRLSLESEDD